LSMATRRAILIVTRRAIPFVMSSMGIGPALGPVQNKTNFT
jgi:hypothetical protein